MSGLEVDRTRTETMSEVDGRRRVFRILIVVFVVLIIAKLVLWSVFGYERGGWRDLMAPFVMICLLKTFIQPKRSTLWTLLACAGAIGIVMGHVLESM